MTFKVLGVGVATIDHIATISSFPHPNTKIHCEELETQGGGNCANTLVTLSRLGIKTKILTKTGNDGVGKLIKESLKDENVNVDNIIQEGEKSSLSYILVDKKGKTRTIINKRGADYSEMLNFSKDILKEVDLVYLDGRFSITAKKIAYECIKSNIPIVLEAESTKLKPHLLFKYAKVVITSENFHFDFFKSDNFTQNLKKILKHGPEIAIVTLGEKGVIAAINNEIIKIKANKIKAVDTTGAGDAFIGGFIFGYLNKMKLNKILKFASYIAAIKCQQIGARKGLPLLKNIPKKYK